MSQRIDALRRHELDIEEVRQSRHTGTEPTGEFVIDLRPLEAGRRITDPDLYVADLDLSPLVNEVVVNGVGYRYYAARWDVPGSHPRRWESPFGRNSACVVVYRLASDPMRHCAMATCAFGLSLLKYWLIDADSNAFARLMVPQITPICGVTRLGEERFPSMV